MIDRHRPGNCPFLMICKEDPAIVRALKFKYGKCNYLASGFGIMEGASPVKGSDRR